MKRKGQLPEEFSERKTKRPKMDKAVDSTEISSTTKYYNEISKEICFSSFQEIICYICDKKFPSKEEILSCQTCSKLFHPYCHPDTYFSEQKCKFCVNK